MEKFVLKLYITGMSPNSERAIVNLQLICNQALDDTFEIEVIDVLEKPQLAIAGKILATPTLIKSLPLPARRVIGDLSDTEKVLMALTLIRTVSEKGS